MWRKVAFIIIIGTMIFSVSDYFFTMRDSYNKYLEGEYYFQYRATTRPVMDPDTWFDTIENFEHVSSLDFSDTKTFLLYEPETEVYAIKPHDGVCTVIYGSQTAEDFPIYNLRFEGNDEEYFNGTKQLTYEEYIDLLNTPSAERPNGIKLGTNDMTDYKNVLKFSIIMVCVDAFLFLLLFLFHKSDNDVLYDIALIVGTLYNIFFEIISAVMF